MADVQSLEQSLKQYEVQLSQVQMALLTAIKGPDRDNLLSLESDMQELISLTKESLKNVSGTNTSKKETSPESVTNDDDLLSKEYALFKAELEQTCQEPHDTEKNDNAVASEDIEDELKVLEGMKCRAPHSNSWGGTGYHNAMVSCIHREDADINSINDIKVRVLFVNPTHKDMLPCPYYLDGACKFSDEQCHYSHGEIVPLCNLQEYQEPDFASLRVGSRVLAKQKNNLWQRCVILKGPEKDDGNYRIKFEASGTIVEAPVHDLLPLEDAELEISDSSDESDSDMEVAQAQDDTLIHKSLLTLNTSEPLGSWEKHTKGIGSKLMAKMGYVLGTGLGKLADGRVAPVEATVLPAGKSLDYCMTLREHAGGDKNFFSAERKLQKQRRKEEQQRQRQYRREKAREKSCVFNFLNRTLGDKAANLDEPGTSKSKNNLKTETNRGLNVASFQVSENISRLEKESVKLMTSMNRYTKGSIPYNNIAMQYTEKQTELDGLRSTHKNITIEQNQRKEKAKFSVF